MFLSSLRELKRTRGITLCALLIAIYVVVDFFEIDLQFLQISIKFLPLAAMGMLLGPSAAFLGGGVSDVLAYLIHPNAQSFHPGFTLSTMLTGMVFGIFLYRKELKVWRLIAAVSIVNVCINLILNTYWISNLMGKGYLAMLPGRFWKNIILLPIEVLISFVVLKAVQNFQHK
ncbi:MAG: folate family ECF transporter S component [Oscillospiraceae bacterium]|nr:folate family ECF transporter S component [Oscillospiraceae bacterium]